ncbi:MAG: hypothetical protein AB1918_03285 [Pseudomonadota bacterium]
MVRHWDDIRQLADMIEAEAEGREIDRHQADQLAKRLAEELPGIRASMDLLRRRMGMDGVRAA